jgi:uncharacterized protein (TIGR03067 family)
MAKYALVLAAAGLALGAPAAPAPSPGANPDKQELKKLQGTWDEVADKAGAKAASGTHLVIADNRITARQGRRVVSRWVITLNSRKRPKWIDFSGKQTGRGETMTFPGVYSLEGDTLTLCIPQLDRNLGRPKELNRNHPGYDLLVFKRRKR